VKKLICKALVLAAISVIPLLAYNLIMDPYLVLRKDIAGMFVCPNERFIKSDYILKNPGKYDSFIFGSSRVSQIPVDYLNRVSGAKFYNMTYISGIMPDHLAVLKLFLRKKLPMKNIIVGLDYFSFKFVDHVNKARLLHYPETMKDTIEFYYTYLTMAPDSSMLNEIKFNGRDALYDITGTGEYYFLRKEALMAKDPVKHNEKFMFPIPIVCKTRIKKTTAEIREFVELCRANNINLKFFVSPEYANSYLCEDIAELNLERTRIADFIDFWDFSNPGTITTNNYNYVDIVHYRKSIGRMIIDRLYHVNGVIPADFGYFVTGPNLKAYLKKCEGDYRKYRELRKPPCIPCQQKIGPDLKRMKKK
jgi:hypothetical protein